MCKNSFFMNFKILSSACERAEWWITSFSRQCWCRHSGCRCCRVTTTTSWLGRSGRRWLWCWWIRSTTGATCRTRSAPTQRAPASRSRRRRWTSPAAVRCSSNRRCWRTTARVSTCRTTPSSSNSSSTRAICWIRNAAALRFKTMLGDWLVVTSQPISWSQWCLYLSCTACSVPVHIVRYVCVVFSSKLILLDTIYSEKFLAQL